MLGFLRRIRRSLIEEGHLRKYLYYAIGEILLVSIGILLALQVNNWNEKRIERALEAQYVEWLIQDLVADSLTMASTISVGKLKEESIEKVIQALRDPVAVRQSPGHALPMLAFTYSRPALQMTTFQELLSAGNLRLIQKEDIRIKISDHYRIVQEHYKRLDERRTQLIQVVQEIFPTSSGEAAVINGAFFSEPHTEERLDRLLSIEYGGLINQEQTYSQAIVNISGTILEHTESLISDLRTYQVE